jgi:hypothetical protein
MLEKKNEVHISYVRQHWLYLMVVSMCAKKSSKARYFSPQSEIKALGMTPYLDHTVWQSQVRK